MSYSSEPYQILFIEDSVIDQMSLHHYFKKESDVCRYDMVQTIAEGIEILKNGSFDIVVTDYQLPDGDALDIIDKIKDVPIILVTGAGTEQLAVNALKAGVYDYIIKDTFQKHLGALAKSITKAIAHKRSEELLRVSQERYKILIESASDLIFEIDNSGRFVFTTEKVTDFTGISSEDILGKFIWEIVSKEYVGWIKKYLKSNLDKSKVGSLYLECEFCKPNGHKLWIGQKLEPVYDKKRNVTGFMGIVRDISSKKKYELGIEKLNHKLEYEVKKRTNRLLEATMELTKEVELRKKAEISANRSRQEYIDLFNNAHDAILIYDAETNKILEANHAAFRLYGYSREEFIGMHMENIYLKKESENNQSKILKSLGNALFFESEQIKKDESIIFVEVSAVNVVYEGKNAILSQNRNVTIRKEFEKQLELERKDRIAALIDGQEIERKRISSDLHDGLGQHLSAAKMFTNKLLNSDWVVQDGRELLGEINHVLDYTIQEIQNVIKNLSPATLVDFGLDAAIRSALSVIDSNTDLEVNYKVNGETCRIPDIYEITVYRIAQEAISNSIKHSYSNKMDIVLDIDSSSNEIYLEVKDYGKGFDITSLKSNSFGKLGNGISNMFQRAELLGLELNVNSSPGEGTLIALQGKMS